MNNIGAKIRQIREIKGLSQDYVATELGISQPSYARLEKEDERISIIRLINIAEILKTSVAELINEKAGKVINQQNSENPSAYVDTVINADKEHIQTLKEEIVFLREQLSKR
ncbi:MAG: helix-turn-helix transcriptional regulator [Flavobacteriales bacterium]|nr:helix-turn-helix transcriptional regulator [Flavobacteriales bacterium]